MAHAAQRPDSAAALPATLRLGPVHLVVFDLDRSLAWYERALGLRRMGDAALGDGVTPVAVLHEDPDARPAGRHAGLYHYALLYPSREELARAVLRVSAAQAPVQGLSDHGTHEAVYLPDPDGNGIELAADRPREQWPTVEEMYGRGPQPLDLDALLATIAGEEPAPTVGEGLRVGHLHLHVGDIEEALAFYRDGLGFELQASLGTAAFVSAGGYHHHVGLNVWKGRGVGPAPPHTAGLEHWTIELGAEDEVGRLRARLERAGHPVEPVAGGFRVRDPWEIALDVVR
jgi:catechol 2,3-dioxygenase